MERHGEAENPIFSSLQKCAQAQGLALAHIPSGYKLALNQAFELAQNADPYDVILTQSSVCTDALLRAFRLLHIQKIPPILTIGACAALPEKAVTLYHLDYGFLGIRIIKLFSKLDRDSASAEKELFYAPKGFADSFPGLQRMPDTQLTMLTLENSSTQALRKLLPEFEHRSGRLCRLPAALEHRSGIRVKLIGVPYDDLLAQLNLIGPHFTYDMIRIDVAQFGDIGQSIYRPLDELSISPEGLSPRLIKNGYDSYSMLNGRVYALPLDPSVQIFLYRTDLFHDAKLCRAYYERFHENLVVPATYEQYLHAAEFFTRSCNPDSPTEYGTTMTCGSASVAASDFLPFYLSRIDRFGSTPETLRLDCPEMQAAMRQYHALEKFSCKQNWWGDSIQKFAEGKTAMTVIYSNYAAELINSGNSVVVGRVGAAILPGCKPLLGGGIVGISRYSQKAEACKQFFHWYYSADVASLLVRLGGTSPIVDAYEDFQNYSIFPWMNTSKKSFGLGQRGVINQTPERFSIPKYEFAVGTAVRNVVQDLMTPEDASRMAQALYDAADPVCR